MSQWYSSWIPRFPSLNFAFPTNLQRRFISFVLRKSLGHFLKPGQLDQRQIDSQIGAGYVQISDLELNHEAINDLLSDYPLVLHDGFASSITTRIPWPNPLTSSLGVVMESLQLTFHVRPDWEQNATSSNLTESVASMAESFIHEELFAEDVPHPGASVDPAALASQADASANVPGGLGLDSFQATEIETASADLDPAGVSFFASFIERLLARFEFDARDTKVTIVHPGSMSLTVSIPEIRFRTEGDVRGAQTEGLVVSRKLSIFNIAITVRQLQIPQDISSTRRTRTDSPSSPSNALSGHPHSSTSSSTSSLDEEAQFHMSQSLAYLPPLSSVTSDMAASSMYHSAISTVPIPEEPSIHDNDPFNDNINEEDIIVSSDSTPLELSFRFQASASHKGATISSDTQAPLENTCNDETLHIHLAAGVLACALKAWHVHRISSLLETFSRHLGGKVRSDAKSASSTTTSRTMTVEAEIRSIVVLLLFCPSTAEATRQRTVLNSFYEKPLLPPSLGYDYLRLHFDSLSTSALFGKKPQEPMLISEPSSLLTTTDLSFKLHDISAFFFTASSTSSAKTGSTKSSPILITDYHLPLQYQREHFHTPFPPNPGSEPHLPTFEIIDWTDTKHEDYGIRLNKWRYKGKRKRARANHNLLGSLRSPQHSPDRVAWSAGESSQPKPPPAVTLNFKTIIRTAESSEQPELDVEIKINPLHFFMDLALLLKPHGLFQYLASAKIEQHFKAHGAPSPALSTSGSLPEAFPELHPASANENFPDVAENKFEAESDHDWGTYISRNQYHSATPMRKSIRQANLRFKANLKMIRMQVRCPPPVGRSLRSGALVLDIHAITITNERPPATSVRFAMHQTPPFGDAILMGEFQRFLAAYAPSRLTEAVTFLSSGALLLRSHTKDVTTDTVPSLLFPRITVTSEDQSSLSLRLDLPSLCIDISKHTLDGLQYWADDVSQLTATECATDPELSTDSILGSRFFNKSRASSAGLFSSGADTGSTGITVRAAVSEAYVRMLVPHIDAHPRPIICWASDLGLDISTSSNEKNETVLSVTMSDANISVPTQSDMHQTFFSLTAPRRLLSTTQPIVQVRFVSRTTASSSKESRVLISLNGFTCNLYSDFDWTMDLADFFKSPPGTFESVIPSERTCIGIRVMDGSVRTFAPKHSGSVVCYLDDTEFSTNIVGNSTSSSFKVAVSTASVLAIDDVSQEETSTSRPLDGPAYWKSIGFALLAEISDFRLEYETIHNLDSPDLTTVIIDHINLHVHLCADTLSPFTAFLADVGDAFKSESEEMSPSHTTKTRKDAVMLPHSSLDNPPGLMASVEDLAFERLPEIGAAPDFVEDDLPTNIHYLDESFGAAAGLRELNDEDLEDFEGPEVVLETSAMIVDTSTARGGRETIKMLHPDGVHIVENFYGALAAQPSSAFDRNERTAFRMHVRKSEIALSLYDGYDWIRTRQAIEKEVQEMRRRLAKIKQLVQNGHTYDSDEFEETSALLFNSVHIGLRDAQEMDQSALVAAIDEELKDDVETATQSSWQTLRAPVPRQRPSLTRVHGKRLTRSNAPSLEFQLRDLESEVYRYHPDEPTVSRILATVRDVEIFDHIKRSTWRKFLTSLRTDSRGNIRETGSNMVRIELLNVRPVQDHPSEESRLRAKILPLRLYVDQDAVDFLKKFFSFADPESTSNSDSSNNDETYFQFVEVFPIDLKLDYKPRHVDYRALREGRTIELMNFFHFDGAEMTLRHITLSGVTGWARLFELLNDLWTPDVKATQLVDVISGVAPIRSVVNVGSGFADLILLPIAQYKKDGRIVRGIQKGTTAFVKSTATEAVKMGAHLATGTQVILEQAESVLGSQFKDPITAETVQTTTTDEIEEEYMETSEENSDSSDLISKYAQQPTDIKEGMRSAYKSLRKNFTSAAQTILAVPMEVYERSGNEGPIRSVIRAVPIAVLKPMIGASEAVSKTLLGLHNTLDPDIRYETEAKYKQ